MKKEDYSGCWYCDNILDHPEQVGLLYLGFPRCFVLIPNSEEFYFSTFEEFEKGLCKVNWLDPSDIGNYTEEEKRAVLIKLWTTAWNRKTEKKNYIQIIFNLRNYLL